MGRITIFTSDDLHSEVAMMALKKVKLPFEVISVVTYPSKVAELTAATSHLSLPQVFLNSRYIGGLWELVEQLQKWRTSKVKMAERYNRDIANAPDPKAAVLLKPANDTSDKAESERSIHNIKYKINLTIDLPDNTLTSTGDIMKKLQNTVPRSVIKQKGVFYRNVFSGNTLHKTIKSSLEDLTDQQVLEFCQKLQDWQIVLHVDGTTTFRDDDDELYRLYCDHAPAKLNSFLLWSSVPSMPLSKLLIELDKMMYHVEIESLTKNGYLDCAEVLRNKYFHIFECAICELQLIKMEGLDRLEKLALGLNISILMTKYAFFKLGVVASEPMWLFFCKHVQFTVGRETYTFQSWMEKVLRPASQNDYRIVFALHTGAHMGATVSPPFRLFTAKNVAEELDIASHVFFEDKSNLYVNSRTNEIRVSKVINWYKSDFGKKDREILNVVLAHVTGASKHSLDAAMKAGANLSFLDVDFTRNMRDYAVFEESSVQGDVKGLRKVLTRFQLPRIPPNEQLRLEALRGLNILDSLPEERFDRITSMVKQAFNIPFVFIGLVDQYRTWFKSTQWGCSLDQPPETRREVSFCSHAILTKSEDIFCVRDATKDDRFAENPLVTGPIAFRFYAGYVISVKAVTGEEVNIGSLCVMDQKPRNFSEADCEKLRVFGRQVKEEILRRSEIPEPILDSLHLS